MSTTLQALLTYSRRTGGYRISYSTTRSSLYISTSARDIINPAGLKASGRDELKTLFEAEFESNFGDSSYHIRIYSVKNLVDGLDIADWDCTVEVNLKTVAYSHDLFIRSQDVVDDNGVLLQPLTHTAVVVCRKEMTGWKFASIRGNSLQD